jgi:hypothetical protein
MYCNICGCPSLRLEVSHSLNALRKRTGVVYRTCKKCHDNYHSSRGDFSAWGKRGSVIRKKRDNKKLSYSRRGFQWR